MAPRIGIVADDLTGAADTGVAFLVGGLTTIVTWKEVVGAVAIPAADVLAVDTGSRAMDAAAARLATGDVVAGLRARGVMTLYKKIDSLLRGHVGEEVAAAREAWRPGTLAIVAPAFPATGRSTVGGRQLSHGVPVDAESIPDILSRVGLQARLLRVESVRAATFGRELRESADRGLEAVVCDAEMDADLLSIARAGASLGAVVWVGSGGLAHALAAGVRGCAPTRAAESPRPDGPILTVVGSRRDLARSQADELIRTGVPEVRVPASALAGDADEHFRVRVPALGVHLMAGRDIVLTIEEDESGRAGDDPRLTRRLGERLRPWAAHVGALILTGGDTAVGVLQAWDATGIRLVDEIEPGVVLSEMLSPRPIPVVTKSGSFGGREALVRAWTRLNDDRAAIRE